MVNFYSIRHIALEHFYNLTSGNDFFWLKDNFERFELMDIELAKEFIIALSYIYQCYYAEAYVDSFELFDDSIESQELFNMMQQYEKNCYEVLLSTYKNVVEIDRQFALINISDALPHTDGLRYLVKRIEQLNISNEDWNEPPPF